MQRKIAIPTVDGKSCAHFGHCEGFAVIDISDKDPGKVDFMPCPVHQPGSYPLFLKEIGVNVVIAGGMGKKAQNLFSENNIQVFMGVGVNDPLTLVEQFLKKELQSGGNLCNHGTTDHNPNCGD